MDTVTVKTCELIGPALDWVVAKCEGRRIEFNYQYTEETRFDGWWQLGPNHWQPLNSYSTNWSQGGPIIERENIDTFTEKKSYPDSWLASVARYQNAKKLVGWRIHQYGPTPLIAAMRCYVASKLGDTVQIPKELAP